VRGLRERARSLRAWWRELVEFVLDEATPEVDMGGSVVDVGARDEGGGAGAGAGEGVALRPRLVVSIPLRPHAVVSDEEQVRGLCALLLAAVRGGLQAAADLAAPEDRIFALDEMSVVFDVEIAETADHGAAQASKEAGR